MNYNLDILISANKDYFEICELLKEYGNDRVISFIDSFSKFLNNVSNMPFMFPQYARKPKYRKAALVYDYLVFYQIGKTKKTVKIYRILNSKRNIEDLL